MAGTYLWASVSQCSPQAFLSPTGSSALFPHISNQTQGRSKLGFSHGPGPSCRSPNLKPGSRVLGEPARHISVFRDLGKGLESRWGDFR